MSLLILFSLFALPLINYSIGFYFSDVRVFQILISLVSLFVLEMVWIFFIFGFINKLFQFIFELFVDVIPHDGRTKEEAQMVVHSGEKAVRSLAIQKHPTTWTDEVINEIPKNDWIGNIFYRNNIVRRCNLVREYYQSMPVETPYVDSHVNKVLEENNLTLKWHETVLTSLHYRRSIIAYSFFLFLLILNPYS
tara:strand:+ start:143 stop:721 length:579 start_codon:yes stop_codon:yes gene_type:complete